MGRKAWGEYSNWQNTVYIPDILSAHTPFFDRTYPEKSLLRSF
jgi:hypothetical protein